LPRSEGSILESGVHRFWFSTNWPTYQIISIWICNLNVLDLPFMVRLARSRFISVNTIVFWAWNALVRDLLYWWLRAACAIQWLLLRVTRCRALFTILSRMCTKLNV
jgi:hypothetical protein